MAYSVSIPVNNPDSYVIRYRLGTNSEFKAPFNAGMVYMNCPYLAPAMTVDVGTYLAQQIAFGENQMSSVYVNDGFRIILYEGNSFSGSSYTINGPGGIVCLDGIGWNDIVSSFKVEFLINNTLAPTGQAVGFTTGKIGWSTPSQVFKLGLYTVPIMIEMHTSAPQSETDKTTLLYTVPLEFLIDLVSELPSSQPTLTPTKKPTARPTGKPTVKRSMKPTFKPSGMPSSKPTFFPT